MKVVLWLLACAQACVVVVGAVSGQAAMIALGMAGALLTALVMNKRSAVDKDIQKTKQELAEHVAKRTELLMAMVAKFEHEALVDQLTGLFNRRGGEDAIRRAAASSHRGKKVMSFVLIDMDHFKRVNDDYGHGMGDIVLCAVARTIVATLRQADIAIRWGGEELLAALPDTDLLGAVVAAEKLRSAIAMIVFEGGCRVTASFGVSEGHPGEELHTALARADMHLYISKAKGRNCVSPSFEETS